MEYQVRSHDAKNKGHTRNGLPLAEQIDHIQRAGKIPAQGEIEVAVNRPEKTDAVNKRHGDGEREEVVVQVGSEHRNILFM